MDRASQGRLHWSLRRRRRRLEAFESSESSIRDFIAKLQLVNVGRVAARRKALVKSLTPIRRRVVAVAA
jgi:hypothetical protein